MNSISVSTADQDDLARALLRRGLEQERLDALLCQRERDIDSRIDALTETLSFNAADGWKRSAPTGDPVRQRLGSRTDEPAGTVVDDALAPIRDAEVEIALLAAAPEVVMNRRARTPGFIEGVVVAAVLSVVGGALSVLLWVLISPQIVQGLAASDARLLAIVAISLCYLLYLLWRSQESAGRISMVLLWVGISLPVLLLLPHWTLAFQLALLWLTRSLFLQRGFSAALGDLGLIVVGLGAGRCWPSAPPADLAAAIWTFYLVQAPFGVRLVHRPSPAGNADRTETELKDTDLTANDGRFERPSRARCSEPTPARQRRGEEVSTPNRCPSPYGVDRRSASTIPLSFRSEKP